MRIDDHIANYLEARGDISIVVGREVARRLWLQMSADLRKQMPDLLQQGNKVFFYATYGKTKIHVDPSTRHGDLGVWDMTGKKLNDFATLPDDVFTPEAVASMQLSQSNPRLHGYTCLYQGDAAHLYNSHVLLVPTVRGWICPYCDHTQKH